MAENIPQLPFANERPPAPTQPGPKFTAEDIRSRMAAINNYVNTNQPQILAGLKQAEADQANYISQFKNYTGIATPQINKVQNLVSGNVMSGPNPGLKQVNIPTAEYVDALMNKSKIEQATKSDPYFFARPTSFNASKYGLNYDRYYSHPKFKELGFSIYRDNESIYNANSSWFDDFRRMGSKWLGLAWQGGSGLFKNWGKFGAFGEAEDAAQMENDLSVAMSSKSGVGAWTTNFLANSAYTMGIMAEIGLEEGVLMAAAPFTGGATGVVGAARFGQNASKLGKSMKIMAETLKNAEKAKSFWTGAKGAASSIGNFVNPLTRTTQVGADLFKANSAVNRLDDFAKMKHTFGAFYRDMREINAVTAESRLEAGFVQNKVANDALNQFVNENGRMPNADEAKIISDNAIKAAQATYYANVPMIFASNRIVLGTVLGGVPGAKRLMSKGALNSPLYKIIENPNWKKTGGKPVELIQRGLFNTGKRVFSKEYLKSIPSKFTVNGAKATLGKTVGGSLRYLSANLMEGVQELYQEGIQASATDYYLNQYYIDMYKDPLIAAKHDMWASLSKGFGEQMSPQGLDVFASGFLMGGLTGVVQNKVISPAYRGYLKVSDYMTPGQDSYGEYMKAEKERMQRYVNARNSVEVDRNQYVNWLDENVVLQRDLQAEYEKAMAEDDTETAEQAQGQALFNHVHTLLQTDKYDIFLEQLEDLRQLSPEDLADAFNEDHSKAAEVSGRLDNALKKAKSIKTRYDAINSKFKNPYNPDLFNKDTEAESYNRELLGYTAFESAKKMAAFNEYSFDEALEKASALVTKAAAKGPLGAAAARDFSVIYDVLDNRISPSMIKNAEVQSYMDLLLSEVSVLQNGTAEQKTLAKRKRTQIDNLQALTGDLYEYSKSLELIDGALTDPDKKAQLDELARSILDKMQVIDESTGQAEINFESAQIPADVLVKEYFKDMVWDSYAKYSKNIAELNNVFPIMDELENSFQDLLAYNQIKLEAKRAARYVNILADPMSIIQMADRLQSAMSNAAANRTRYHEEAFKKFNDMRNMDDFFNDLLGLKAYFNPEEIDAFLKEGKIPERFIDAGDGSTILKSDPRYNQIIDLIEKYETTAGRTFSGKPSRPKPPAPEPAAEPTAKPTGVPDEETEPGEVTSPLSQYPEDVQEKLKAAHAEAVKQGGTSDIVEWIKESPEAAIIIKGTKKRKKRKVVSDELEGEITEANPKSISGAGNLILPGKEGWKLSKDKKQYEKGKEKAIRVSDLKENPKPEDSPKMTFSQNRGNFIDLIIRRFAEPSDATKLSIKDEYINGKLMLDQLEDSTKLAVLNGLFPDFMNDFAKEASAANGLTVTEGFKQEMVSALKELALELEGFTWYTGFPTLQGTLANQSVAGTPDLVGEKDGEFYIMDFKTSAQSRRLNKDLYDRDDQIQQNAYADLFEQNTGKKVNRVFIINFIVNADEKNNLLQGVKLDRFTNANDKETVFIEIPRTSVDELKGIKAKEGTGKSPTETGVPKGTIKVEGKVITMEGVPGSIDFTDNEKNTDFDTMMPEITKLLKNWDKDFVNNNLVNYNGQFLFNHEGRVFVLVKAGNFIVPYYFSSSGTSGKAIDWHYVFGIDDVYGWIIKGGVDKNGEMIYSKQMQKLYPKAIAELERIKKEIRTKLAMTPQTRDVVRTQLDRYNLGKTKYTKTLSSIYKGLDVVEKASPDGIETKDNYDYLINTTLGLIGLDKPGAPAATTTDTKSDNKTVFRILEKALYEGNDKRYSDLTKEQLQKLSPETRQYLLDLYEKLAPYNSTYQRLGKILDPQTNREIVTEDQKIKYVTSNYFGGKGRPSSELGSPADPKHKDLVFPVPSAKVIDDFNNILGAKISGEEIAALKGKGVPQVDWSAVIDRAASAQEVDKIMDQIYTANASTPELIDKALVKKQSFKPAKASSPTRFKGKLIWAPPGTVDPIVFERYDAVNADDVLKEVLVDTGFMKSGESFEEANMRLVKSDQKDRVNGEFLRKINELKKEGKTIISQNWFLEKQADVISRPSLEKAFDKEVYNKKIKANSFASSQYEESQEEGWESRVNNVEKNTNLSVKELFEKDTKVSQPVQNIMQAVDIYALRAIAKQYAASDEDRPKYFYRVDKENNKVTLSPEDLYTILAKRGDQLVKRGINGSNDLKTVLMEIENILKPSEPMGAEPTTEEKAELNNVVQTGNDTSDIADEATNLDSEAESKSQKDIDDEFTDSIGCK